MTTPTLENAQVLLGQQEPEPLSTSQLHDDVSQERLAQTLPHMIPKSNLYSIDQGWLFIVALPEVDHASVSLELEGEVLKLLAQRIDGRTFSRSVHFPQNIHWGELEAQWEGDLLKVTLMRARPQVHRISIA